MRQGTQSIETLAAEVTRRQNAKRDFITPSNRLKMHINSESAAASLGLGFGEHTFGINDLAHAQIARHFNIPADYYNRLKSELPALMAHNVNTLAVYSPADEKRLVRTLDGDARAFLSDSYRCIDNIDLRHLIEGADLSRWGVANAITRTAADSPSYDRASELEMIGGSLMGTERIPTAERVTVRRRRSRSAVAAAN